MHLTVGEIAERIREPDEDLGAVVDRLRNFTKEGLLKPIGSRSSGTGRKRRYPEAALIDAALLNKLKLMFGIPAARVPLFGSAIKLAREAATEFEEQQRDGRLIYLIVGVVHGPRPLARSLTSELQYVADEDVAAQRFGDAPEGWASRQLALPENFDFGLVINLTSMFKRIGLGGTNG